MNDVAILPCPFCGDPDPAIDEIDSDQWAVVCNDCGAIGPHLTDDGSKTLGAQAIERWNARRA
jgi:Lar family restriction alleviation protein